MKSRFILFRRGETFYCEDTTTANKPASKPKTKAKRQTLLHARNEAVGKVP